MSKLLAKNFTVTDNARSAENSKMSFLFRHANVYFLLKTNPQQQDLENHSERIAAKIGAAMGFLLQKKQLIDSL